METSGFLVNLTIALAAAVAGSILAQRFRQSNIIGYLIAGVAIGPWTPGFVGDIRIVEALADIGIVLLMFTIGIQLSLRDLLRVGPVALGGGGAQVLLMIGIGFAIGIAIGWQWIEALFFGAVLSNSSSTVISKVLEERSEQGTTAGRVALAWSTVQDFSTIVLVVVLSALATGSTSPGLEVIVALGKAALFLVLLLPIGSWVLPRLFQWVAALRNRETFLVTVAAVALGMASLSTLFGLSLALGAFVAGVVIAESDLSYQILGDAVPLRDIFAAMFFVSVGMLFDPSYVLANPALVALTAFLIIAVKGAIVTGVTWLFRFPASVALSTGVLLGQSAEFSFLLARLGANLGSVSPNVFSLMLSGSVISIVLAPTLHRTSSAIERWIDGRRSDDRHPALVADSKAPPLRNHAIICGFGRVGSVVGWALERRGFNYVVIEPDRRVVEHLRESNTIAFLGRGENPILLDRAGIDRALVLVVAVPDAFTSRQVVSEARRLNPHVSIVVRTHQPEDRAILHGYGVSEVVFGELELALELTRFTLRRFGVSGLEIQALLQHLRGADETAGYS